MLWPDPKRILQSDRENCKHGKRLPVLGVEFTRRSLLSNTGLVSGIVKGES